MVESANIFNVSTKQLTTIDIDFAVVMMAILQVFVYKVGCVLSEQHPVYSEVSLPTELIKNRLIGKYHQSNSLLTSLSMDAAGASFTNTD